MLCLICSLNAELRMLPTLPVGQPIRIRSAQLTAESQCGIWSNLGFIQEIGLQFYACHLLIIGSFEAHLFGIFIQDIVNKHHKKVSQDPM